MFIYAISYYAFPNLNMFITKCVWFIAIFLSAVGDRSTENPKVFRFFKRFILQPLTGKTTTRRGLEDAKRLGKIQDRLPESTPFPCNTAMGRSAERPTSVHQIRPGDIDVIASLGDSLSVGNGLAASRIAHIAVDNRGLSWAIGGRGTWKQYLTLPNILKEFNKNLVGYAIEDAYGDMKAAQFSVSEPGAMSRDMPHAAKILVQRIKSDKRVNFQKDWKLVTLFISGNDFCTDVCYLPEAKIESSHETHRKDLYEVFDYLKNNLPRTIVNVVQSPKTNIGTELLGRPAICVLSHMFECPCIFGEAHKIRQAQMRRVQENWINTEIQVVEDPRYRDKDDFVIIYQPFIANARIPKINKKKSDFTFLSTDCYHFSQKGSAMAANAVWNNMLEPYKNKTHDWNPIYQRFLCPSELYPFIFTWRNSPRTL